MTPHGACESSDDHEALYNHDCCSHDDACTCDNHSGHNHSHHSEHHHEHSHKADFIELGCGVLRYTFSSHQGASIISCNLELQGAELPLNSLQNILMGAASDVEAAGGIIGHIKCIAAQENASSRISITQANVEPSVFVDNLSMLTKDSKINVALIVFGVSHDALLDYFTTRLKRVL